MYDLDPKLRMELSELLFEKLGMEGCWHKWETNAFIRDSKCKNCSIEYSDETTRNPNLFLPSAFLTVFRAVASTEKGKRWLSGEFEKLEYIEYLVEFMDSPSFPLRALKWLLEQDSEGERLSEILDKGASNE